MSWGAMGFTGITPEIYLRFSDEYILEWLTAKRTKRGIIVPEWKLEERRRQEEEERREPAVPLSKEELEVPDEAFRWLVGGREHGPPVIFTLMFWRVWKQRGLTTEQINEKYREHMEKHGCVFRG